MCILVAITIWVMDKLPCFLIYSPMFIKLFLYTMLKGQTGITLKHFIHNLYIYSLFTLLSIHCLFVVVIVVYHQCLTHAPGQLLGSRLAFSLPRTQLTTAAFSALFSLLLPLRRASTGGKQIVWCIPQNMWEGGPCLGSDHMWSCLPTRGP